MITPAEYENRGRDDRPEATGSSPAAQEDYFYNEIAQRTDRVLAEAIPVLSLSRIVHAAADERRDRLAQYSREVKGKLDPAEVAELHRRMNNILTEMGL